MDQFKLTLLTVILGSIFVIAHLAFAKLVVAEHISITPISAIGTVVTPGSKDCKEIEQALNNFSLFSRKITLHFIHTVQRA